MTSLILLKSRHISVFWLQTQQTKWRRTENKKSLINSGKCTDYRECNIHDWHITDTGDNHFIDHNTTATWVNLTEDCRLLSDLSRRTLRSSATDFCTLVVPWTHNKFGDRSFSAAGPWQWNDLPPELRRPDLFFFQCSDRNWKCYCRLQSLVTSHF